MKIVLILDAFGMCKLVQRPSVEYNCPAKGTDVIPCTESVPEATLVRPRCSANYNFPADLPNMHCVDGSWDYIPTCLPECGIFPQASGNGPPWLSPGGLVGVPWFASIYMKYSNSDYRFRCGGTLVSRTVVLTAAHCFFEIQNNKTLPPGEFSVGFGKLAVGWSTEDNGYVQKSDVSVWWQVADIKFPPDFFLGANRDFRGDIAAVILAKGVTFGSAVLPACLDFDVNFEKQQLREDQSGMIAGWGPLQSTSAESNGLKVIQMHYMPMAECSSRFAEEDRMLLTTDKICAANKMGTGLCKGDSGGGIFFPEFQRGLTRFYLRGVISVVPIFNPPCIVNSPNIFVQITKHEHFIRQFL